MQNNKNQNRNTNTQQNKTDTAQKLKRQARGQNNMEAGKELNTSQAKAKRQNKR